MRTASISDTKTSLSEYVKRISSTGEGILVTDRGKSVAKLFPVRRGDTPEDKRMEELELRGLIKTGKGHFPSGFWDTPAPRDKDSSAVMALIEEREEGP